MGKEKNQIKGIYKYPGLIYLSFMRLACVLGGPREGRRGPKGTKENSARVLSSRKT